MKPGLIALALSVLSLPAMAQHFNQIPAFETAYPPERIVAIPPGEVVAMPSGDIDLLWIEGTCVAPRDADLSLKVREIVVAPGGKLDMGTEADPVRAKLTITIADGEFLADDSAQWGHGILAFGDITVWGIHRKTWTENGPHETWQEGDEIRTVKMSPDCLTVMGQVSANMTSNVIVKSENPVGTRGHVIITDDANCSIGHVAVLGMGRTKPEPLSPTNLVGRYPIHFHHSMGQSRKLHGVVVDGLDYGTKWGIVVHHSSWVTVENCVATRTGGAGFVTEDGSEAGNTFKGNLAFDNRHVKRAFPTDVKEGFTGAGFWFKSMANYIDDNVAIDNSLGCQTAITAPDVKGVPEPGQRTSVKQLSYQTVPGGPMDGTLTAFQSTLSAKRNRFVGNRVNAMDCWGSVPQTFTLTPPNYWHLYALPVLWEDCLFAFSSVVDGAAEVSYGATQSCVAFKNCEFITKRNLGSINELGYHRVLYFDGCHFTAKQYGLTTGRGTIVADCVFDTPIGIWYQGLSAQDWPFGVTAFGNSFAGSESHISHTTLTLDQIKPHEVTLEAVYANIEAFRNKFSASDDNAEEKARLTQEIQSVTQQIAELQAMLTSLQAQLEAIGQGTDVPHNH